ncbi:BTB/POZ domain-containing protein At4g08455 isoform X1 [Eucalyptus grandis]|uniref:BTB/POZ domain-containing protein At4g08455 isoform X1 n=1 Tax=Eucalyptus grandis TaxID=71139 RepID=UPI00192EB6A9|nr:BTB/POZ domain-containing protein At4g08455 isoform X1 [Eucalyptus grandis]
MSSLPQQMRRPCKECCKDECVTLDSSSTCEECHEKAKQTKEKLKREIENLKAEVAFLSFWSPADRHHHHLSGGSYGPGFTDVVLVAAKDGPTGDPSTPVPAHRAILAGRSAVFKALLENETEESRNGTIKISDVSYNALRLFVGYLYVETCLDEQMACELLVLAEKYQVECLKAYCEKFLVSKLNWDNSLMCYAFAHQHNANRLLGAALSLIMDNLDGLRHHQEYLELVEKDPCLVVELYEAILAKQKKNAAPKDTFAKQ